MIQYNSKTIKNWNFDASNIVKVYRNGAVCYYKLEGSPTPTGQTPCYAVVDDITQYQETEFVDVYDKKTKKWYKLNNLNQYEEYGVYGSGRDITYYEGKLTVDDGYEYEYSYETGWANRGALTGTSKIIKSPEYIERTSTYAGYCSLLEYLTEDTKFIIKHRQTNGGGGRVIGDYVATDADDWRFFFVSSTLYYDFLTERKSTTKSMPMSAAEEWEVGNYYIKNTATGAYLINGTPQTFSSRPDHLYIYHSGGLGNAGETADDYGQIWYIKIYKNDVLVRDFIPWTDMNGNYGLYDKVNNVTVQSTGQMTASTTVNDVEVGSLEYPLHYQEKQDPPKKLVFDTMEEALAYQCPYVGVLATIGGVKYKFTYDEQYDTYQWSEINQYLEVNLNSQWETSTSYGNISDTGNYDFYQSFSNKGVDSSTATMFITIEGYTSFTFKVRDYTDKGYDYVVVNNIDDTTIPSWYPPTVGSGTASSGKVYYSNKDNSSSTTWYDVTFDNLDGGEHIITITYGKDSVIHENDDRGYVAIPKTQ